MIREKLGATKGASAIIYVATRKQCEEIEKVLLQHSSGSGPPLTASAYHAGMPTAERHRIHNDFLQGRIQVIVATVAFGMGIDKPDIRYIIHDGPPKTMEEYFQQVGRAGRDGCMSDCWMFYTEHEFVNYQSDFYMGALSGPARAATEESLAALRRYATNGVECRRKSMLEYFGEKAAFEQCGTCDICERTKAAGGVDGLRHDFTAPARVVLTAVRYAENNKLGITGLLDVLWGAYKPKTGSVSMELETAMRELTQMRTMLKPPYSKLAFKDLVPLLTGGGFITVVPRSIQAGQYTRVYESFELSSMGRAVLVNPNARVMLPASEAVLREEAEQKKALAKREQELVDAGIDLAQIPSNELLEGTGPVLNAYQHWIRTLKHYRECHQPARAVRLEALLQSVLEWRSRIAGKLGVAPVSLLSDHLARKIAYARPTDVGVLRAVGVRVAGAQELCDIIRQWMDTEAVVAAGGTTTGAASSGALRRQLKIPDHFKPATNALSTVSAPPTRKLVKQPPWEISYDRFQLHNEHPQAIAMSQPSGRPVQVSTVFGHLLTAITHGRPLDLARALHTCDVTLPSVEKYERYRAAVVASGVDVMDEKVLMKPILTAIVGEEVVDKLEKSEAEKAMISEWYAVLRLLTTLQRAGVPVEVVDEESVESSSMKRQRV